MSLQAMDWALRTVQGITPTQKLILICLANHAGPDGTCWPSQNTISDYSGLSRETISRNLSDLEKRGFIHSVQRRDESGRDLSKIYILNITKEEGLRKESSSGETENHRGVTQDHTGGATLTGGCDTGSHPVKSRFSEHRGVTENHRGCDTGSQGGVTQDHTSKENLSRRESINRTKRIKIKTHVEIAKSAIVDPPPLPDLPILWKTHCPSLPQIRETTQNRRDKIQIRLKEHPDPSWWGEVMAAIEKSAFCRGENRTGWRATFDWLIENQDNAIKVLEGKYSGANRSPSRGNFDFDVDKWAREG